MTFVWSGDTAGQGWGINLEWGGMKIYETMRRLEPDFFVHSGDMIYADGPIQAEVALPGGRHVAQRRDARRSRRWPRRSTSSAAATATT